MDIVQRLYRLMRSNWAANSAESRGRADDGDFHAYQRQQDFGRAEPGAQEDPELAGYYANLELPYGASRDEVHSAWKRLMKQYHPDLHAADPEKRRIANQLTAELTDAYRHLDSVLEKATA